jgi:type VI protein secretion system component VasK
VVDSFLPTIERNSDSGSACWAHSWRYLRQHAEIAALLASALRERAQGNPSAAQLEWDALKQRVWEMEDELHPVLDVYLFTRVYDGLFKTGQPG